MKQTITKGMFIEAFKRMGRQDQFSREALTALFEHFEQYEQDTGEEIELDVIGICCEYVESTFDEVVRDYKLDDDYDIGAKATAIRYLGAHTTLVEEFEDTIVYQQF